jgi:hypothetical protein
MPLPPFESTIAIRKAIISNKLYYKTFYSDELKTSKYFVIKNCVLGSTFRSKHFTGGEYKPSDIFRTWAQRFFFNRKKLYQKIIAIKSPENYRKLHTQIVDSLNSYWTRYAKKKLEIGYYCKLIDLLMKMFINCNDLTQMQKLNLLRVINVPLDKYTLSAISIVWNSKLSKRGINILRNPSMSFIGKNYDLYSEIQLCISDAVGKHNPIEFDLVVWNNRPDTENMTFTIKKKPLKKKK